MNAHYSNKAHFYKNFMHTLLNWVKNEIQLCSQYTSIVTVFKLYSDTQQLFSNAKRQFLALLPGSFTVYDQTELLEGCKYQFHIDVT